MQVYSIHSQDLYVNLTFNYILKADNVKDQIPDFSCAILYKQNKLINPFRPLKKLLFSNA